MNRHAFTVGLAVLFVSALLLIDSSLCIFISEHSAYMLRLHRYGVLGVKDYALQTSFGLFILSFLFSTHWLSWSTLREVWLREHEKSGKMDKE